MSVNLEFGMCWRIYLLASDADDHEEFRHGGNRKLERFWIKNSILKLDQLSRELNWTGIGRRVSLSPTERKRLDLYTFCFSASRATITYGPLTPSHNFAQSITISTTMSGLR